MDVICQGDVGLLTHNDQIGNYIAPRSQPEHFWRIDRVRRNSVPGVYKPQPCTHVSGRSTLKRCNVIVPDCLDFEDQFVHLTTAPKTFCIGVSCSDPAEFLLDETTYLRILRRTRNSWLIPGRWRRNTRHHLPPGEKISDDS